MQNSEIKNQNSRTVFKTEFNKRLIGFSLSIIKLAYMVRKERNLSPLGDQLIRSGCSIGANVAEAKSSTSLKEFVRYFDIALKSANETKYWLILIHESSINLQQETIGLLSEVDEITKVLARSILTMKNKK